MPAERPRKCVVFVLAHQDDEGFFSILIRDAVARGHDLRFVYLTDGGRPGIQ